MDCLLNLVRVFFVTHFMSTFFLLMTWCTATYADSTTLHFCDAQWPPFTYGSNGKINKGISYELLTEAFKRLNKKIEIDDIPWARCLLDVEKGLYDGVLDNNNVSPHFIHGHTPTSVYPVAIYVRADYPDEQLVLSNLKGKKIGLVHGYEYPEVIMSNTVGFIPDKAVDDAAMMRKLKVKRYDYVVSDIFSGPENAAEVDVKIKMLKPILNVDSLYLTFNTENKALMQAFEDVFNQMVKEGLVDAIYKKYLPYSYQDVLKMKADE